MLGLVKFTFGGGRVNDTSESDLCSFEATKAFAKKAQKIILLK